MTQPNKLIVDRELLEAAKEKLQIYRSEHSGNYCGGWEYSRLIKAIDKALQNPNKESVGSPLGEIARNGPATYAEQSSKTSIPGIRKDNGRDDS